MRTMLNVYVHQFDGAISVGTLPLAAGLVVASAKVHPHVRAGFDFTITTNRDAPDVVVARYRQPSVVAMSCYPWNLRYSLEVARRAKERFPGCLVVLGGMAIPWYRDGAVSFLAQEPAVDVLVQGEGEVTFREMLASHLRGGDLTGVAGLAVRSHEAPEGVVFAEPRVRMSRDQLAQEPSPYLDGTFDEYVQGRRGFFRALLETNRGCPYSCTFCVWGRRDQQRLHEFPTSRIEGELAWIGAKRFPHIYLVDANFGILPRDLEIARHLVSTRESTGYPLSCYLNLTKNVQEQTLDIVQVLRHGGVATQVELSMQDTNREVLATVKRFNIGQERLHRLLQRCHELELPSYNELILGLPTQTYDSFCDTVIGALTPFPKDALFVYLCRVVENSEMTLPAHRAAHGLVTRNCVMVPSDPRAMDEQIPDYEEIVVGTSTMPLQDWRRAYDFANLVTLLSSLQVMDVVTHYLSYGLGADMKVFYQALQRRVQDLVLSGSGESSALCGIRRELERYESSILSGGPLLLVVEGGGATRWREREALLIYALRHFDQLLDEVWAITKTLLEAGQLTIADDLTVALPEIDELFRYQRFATPTFSRREIVQERFTRDWLGYQQNGASGAPLRSVDLELVYSPPAYVKNARDFVSYMEGHIGALYSERRVDPISRVVKE